MPHEGFCAWKAFSRDKLLDIYLYKANFIACGPDEMLTYDVHGTNPAPCFVTGNFRLTTRRSIGKTKARTRLSMCKSELSLIEKIEILKSGERLYLSAIGSTWICENDMKSWEIGSLDGKGFLPPHRNRNNRA